MKKQRIPGILLMALLAGLLYGCDKSDIPVGEYTFEDVVYVGGISSAGIDYMAEAKAGTEYSIQDDSLDIFGCGDKTYSNITYKREELTDARLEEYYYTEEFKFAADFFGQYEQRYRVGLFGEHGEQIHIYIFLLDDDVFISQFARDDLLIFSIDKIVKNED